MTPNFRHAKYKSMNSLRFFRYTQRRSPVFNPRSARRRASRLLRTSISPKLLIAGARPAACHSSAGSFRRPCNERSNNWIRFIPVVLSRCHITVLVLSGVLALLMMSVLGCSSRPEEHRGVRIATYTQGSLTALPMMLAQQLGYFKREGLDVTVEETPSGAKAIQALLGGSADVASAFHELTVQMAAEGRDLTSFVSLVRYPGYALVPSPASPKKIRRVEELKGVTVAVSSPGSPTDLFLKYVLAQHGLSGNA